MATPKNLTQAQVAALQLLRCRLDPKHPLYAGSTEVTDALSGDARFYFNSWILPVIDFLLEGEAYSGQADDLKRDLSARAAQAQARRDAIASGMMRR